MSDMKCPICQTTLDGSYVIDKVYGCPKCRSIGSIDLWKSLDVAVDALKTVKRYLCEMPAPDGATIFRMACESAITVRQALDKIGVSTKGGDNE